MDLNRTCTNHIPDANTLVVRFSSDGKVILYVIPARGGAIIYRIRWHDGKLTGPVVLS